MVVSKPKIKKFDSITAEKAMKAQLICRVHAEPPANIIIRKKDSSRIYESNQQYDDRIIVEMINEANEQLLTVTIKETRDDDDGTYQCEADNIGGNVMAEAHVTVEHAPVFDEHSLKPVKSWEHHVVNLTCIAKSIPNATIEWYNPSRDISHDPNIVLFNNGPFSTLQVKTTGNTYYVEYRCRATNKLGTNELPFRIEQAFPPKEIKQADFKTITATTATFLIVGPDDDGGMPLTHYTVEYTDDDAGETKRRQWPAAGSQTFILDKLEPEKKYTFKFAASNAVGDGPFTQKRTKVTKKVNSPEEPQIIATSNTRPLQSPYPDKITIQWKIPEDNGAAIQYFQITYNPLDNDGLQLPVENGNAPIQEAPTSTQIELSSLHPNTLYKVEVRAYNRVGYSSPGQITIRTAQGTVSDQQQLQTATFPLEVIIIIVVVVFVLLLIVIDVSCYFMNNCGLLMCLCVHVCGKEQLNEKEKDGIMETGKARDKEKEALKDSLDNDIRNKSPIGSRSSIAKDSPV